MKADDVLDVETYVDGAAVVVRVVGEVDATNAACLAELLTDSAHRVVPPGLIVINLDAVGFFGSAGLAVLASALRRCERSGLSLRVVPNPLVTRVLKLGGMLDALSVHDTVSDATRG